MKGNEFVYPVFDDNGNTRDGGELRKRELFAAMAMQGLLSSWGDHDITDYNDLASDAVMVADALIEQLNKAK